MDLLIPTPRLQNQPSGRRAMESRYRWGSPVGKIFLKQNVYGYASYPPQGNPSFNKGLFIGFPQ